MTGARRSSRPEVWRPGDDLGRLRAILDAGGVVAIPTESSYGLAVDPRNPAGVEAVYRVKERERGKPLLVVVADMDQLIDLVGPGALADCGEALEVWPAPLTVLVGIASGYDVPAAAGAPDLAVRIPARPDLREWIRRLGPLTATSANRSGEPPILEPDHLPELLAACDAPSAVVDAGVLPGGPPSTLADLRSGRRRVLRRGAVALRNLADPSGVE